MISRCTSFFGHRFRARYSDGVVPNAEAIIRALLVPDTTGLIFTNERETAADAVQTRIYEGEVCTRCGLMIETLKEPEDDRPA